MQAWLLLGGSAAVYLHTADWSEWTPWGVAAIPAYFVGKKGLRFALEVYIAVKSLGGKAPKARAATGKEVVVDDGFYRSPEWRQTRSMFWRIADYVTNYKPACMYCGNICDPASREHSHVDHLKPRSKYPELALNLDNLGPACSHCNPAKGDRIWRGGFTVDARIRNGCWEVMNNGGRWPRHWRRDYV